MSVFRSALRRTFVSLASVRLNRGGRHKVLVSYIVHPFLPEIRTHHPNASDVKSIVGVLKDLDCDVTIVDYRRSSVRGRYDSILGFGPCFDQAAKANPDAKLVYFATGAPVERQFVETLACLRRAHLQNITLEHKHIESLVRIPEGIWPIQTSFADLIISWGDEPNVTEFGRVSETKMVRPIVTPSEYAGGLSDRAASMKKFLWFGGKGAIHKGLDLCLEARNLSFFDLTVAGFPDSKFLLDCFNCIVPVPHLGLLDRNRMEHQVLLSDFAFTMLPSCSEANATSVISMVIDRGLIPLVTRNCALASDPEVILIEDLTADAVKRAVERASSLGTDEILLRSSSLREKYIRRHSEAEFERDFRAAIARIVCDL